MRRQLQPQRTLARGHRPLLDGQPTWVVEVVADEEAVGGKDAQPPVGWRSRGALHGNRDLQGMIQTAVATPPAMVPSGRARRRGALHTDTSRLTIPAAWRHRSRTDDLLLFRQVVGARLVWRDAIP
jgi:hypothetical protein